MSNLLAQSGGGFGDVFNLLGNSIYFALALLAMWGAYCCVMVWMRVRQKRFNGEARLNQFLDDIHPYLEQGEFDSVLAYVESDRRAIPQLVYTALENRELPIKEVRAIVIDRFQRDVLSDLEYRLSWVNTVIKSAPMLGLLGTVLGMMGAFSKLAGSDNVDPSQLASDIMLALITTASGLTIAIPLIMATASINVQIRKMEDLVGYGLSRFFAVFKEVAPGARRAA